MKIKKKSNSIAIFHGSLLCICVLCIAAIYYWRQQTLYIYPNEEVCIIDIYEKEILVRGLPCQSENWEGDYIIQIDNSFVIKDNSGKIVDIHSLERGNILLFEYSGPRNPKFPNGTVLNGKKVNACNFRLSEEKLNLRLFNVSFSEPPGTRTPDNLIKSQVLYHLS